MHIHCPKNKNKVRYSLPLGAIKKALQLLQVTKSANP